MSGRSAQCHHGGVGGGFARGGHARIPRLPETGAGQCARAGRCVAAARLHAGDRRHRHAFGDVGSAPAGPGRQQNAETV
eukprot:ctg_1735.g489